MEFTIKSYTSLGEQVAGMSEAIDQTAPMPTNTTDRLIKLRPKSSILSYG
jgi:hypothetical protein